MEWQRRGEPLAVNPNVRNVLLHSPALELEGQSGGHSVQAHLVLDQIEPLPVLTWGGKERKAELPHARHPGCSEVHSEVFPV